MTGLIIPATRPNRTGRTPTLVEYVESYLNFMRAPLREKVMFTKAGRTVIHEPGERIIYGPKGQKIRIVDTQSGTQVEHGNEKGRGVEHQHAHVRPECVTASFGALGGDPDEFIRQRQRERVARNRRIFIPRGAGVR